MTDLPEGLAGPLRLEPPPDLWPLVWVLVGLVLALATARWLWRWRRRRTIEARASPPEPVTTPAARDDLGQSIDELHRRFSVSKAYRDGCHELSVLLRRRLSPRGRFEWLTGREVATELGRQSALGELLVDLGLARFGDSEPRRRDFERFCDRARDVAAHGVEADA